MRNEGLEKFFDVLGELLAFLTLALYICLIIDANWQFIPRGTLYDVLQIAKVYAPLILVGIVGFEATIKRNILIRLLFYAMVAVIVIFMFFPATWTMIIGG
ncbi:MAG: hypothetical protein PHX51_07445 [Clostridia bacterium]|nr:hypothetical protein [Clostridia bacterium]